MRLVDLDPRWLSETVFVFRCPCCRGTPRALWLSCKSAPMPSGEQRDLFREVGLEPCGRGAMVVGTMENVAWSIASKDFATMSVTPSIDASRAGHWHGHITSGQILTC